MPNHRFTLYGDTTYMIPRPTPTKATRQPKQIKEFENAYSEETATDFQQQVHIQIQDTFCQLLNIMSVQESSSMGTGIASVSNDGYSESYKVVTSQEKEEQLTSVIRSGLLGTGLAGAICL